MGKEWWNSHRRSHSRVGYGLGWHSGTDGHLFQCISLCYSCPKTPLPCCGPISFFWVSLFPISFKPLENLIHMHFAYFLVSTLQFPAYGTCFQFTTELMVLELRALGVFPVSLCTFGPIDHSFLLKVLCSPGFPGTILTRSSSNHSFSVSFITLSSSSPGLLLSPLLFSPPHSPSELSSTVMIYSYS